MDEEGAGVDVSADVDVAQAEQQARATRWGTLPARPNPADYVESQPADPQPSVAESAGDPDVTWMLRYCA